MRFYRFWLDLIEEITTSLATVTVVNSKYTQGVYKDSFKLIQKYCNNRTPEVLYPALDFSQFEQKQGIGNLLGFVPKENDVIITSLNRYERKKDIPLAIRACAGLKRQATLVIAGGYDERVIENVEHHLELVNLSKKLGVNTVFLRSISSAEKVALL